MTRDLPEAPFRNVVSISPIGSRDTDRDMQPPESVDDVTTATVQNSTASLPAKSNDLADPLNQPLPGEAGYKLLHVVDGKALIQDASGMYVVKIGSVLPDNSRLSTIEKRGGDWVLITSKGDVIR